MYDELWSLKCVNGESGLTQIFQQLACSKIELSWSRLTLKWWKDVPVLADTHIFHVFPLVSWPSSVSNSVKLFGHRALMVYSTTRVIVQTQPPCLFLQEWIKVQTSMCKYLNVVCLLACTVHIVHVNAYERTLGKQTCSLSRESACELRDAGEQKMQMLLSSSHWHDIHGETKVCVCERERGGEGRKRDVGSEMALNHCVFAVSPSALMHFALKEHACQAAKIDDSLRRMWCRQQVLFCLLMFPVSFFTLYPCSPAWRAFCQPQWGMQAMPHILNSLLYCPHLSESHVAPLA